jgi:hypothetical protein
MIVECFKFQRTKFKNSPSFYDGIVNILYIEPFFVGGKSFEPMSIFLLHENCLAFDFTLGLDVVSATCSKGVTFVEDCPWDIFSLLTN